MKTKIYLTLVFGIVIQAITHAQTNGTRPAETVAPFNLSFWDSYSEKLHLSPTEKAEFISAQQKCHLHNHQTNNHQTNNQKQISPNQTIASAGGCINIDFESGNLNGWNATSGFHPIFNPLGCCPNSGGQHLVTSGASLDPFGGFPVVAPGGTFSLKLGNNLVNGEADRIEQTFLVSTANANFSYKYAVVFQDPGHSVSQQPAFNIEMLDSLGVQIPCTFYNVAAGNNIPGFLNSSSSGVIYKPWSSVIVDLTNYIGQNVTIRFTTYDCALGGHFGYAYIDGICDSFVTGTNDTICAGSTKTYCAPTGFGSYTWNGPGIINNTNQCINASAVGIYTCETTLITGCTGPVFTYTLNHVPNPVVSFNSLNANACAQQFTFTNTSSISSGLITNYNWNFGFATSSLTNPIINFPVAGNYVVNLVATSDNGCSNSTSLTLAIYPNPNVNFLASNTCLNSPTNFTNTSTIASGSIAYSWSFGNGNTSTQQHPSLIYSTAGTYTVTLFATSNQGCMDSATHTITIYSFPSVGFSYAGANACANQYTFANTSTISSGSLNYSWNFGIATSTLVSPITSFPNYGNYLVSLTATSDNGCTNSTSQTLVIYPNPVADFSVSNACYNTPTNFTNNSSIANGSIAYNWSFGNGNTSTQINPIITYTNSGAYSITLIVTSNQGCVATTTNSVTIYPLPQINFSATSVCLSNTTVFNNVSSISSGAITNWIWDFDNNGLPNSTIQSPIHVYPTYGTFSVTLQAISDNNCVSNLSKTVAVYANPTASFTAKNVCFGAVSIFTNASYIASGNTIPNYVWNFGNAMQSPIANPQITYTVAGNYTAQLTAYSNHGCTNTYTLGVMVHHLPNVNFSSNIVCKNQTTAFSNSTSINSGSVSKLRWDFQNDGVWDDTLTVNPAIVYPTTGNFACKLQATSNFQCVAQKLNSVVVHANPIANFSTKSTCLGDVTKFNNSSTSVDGAITSNQWDFNGDGVIDNVINAPSLTYTTNGVYMVRLEVQTNFGCSNVITKSVYVNPKPQPIFTSHTNIGCPSLCVLFANSSSIASGSIVSTQWNFGDGSSLNNSLNPTHCYNTGNYNVKLKLVSDSGCTALLEQYNFVVVHPMPVAGFNVYPDEVDEYNPEITVTSNATGSRYTSYHINDGKSFGSENFNYSLTNLTTTQPIIFQVVKNEFGCGDTISKEIKVKPSFVIFVPNAFTPNGDGLNDSFFAKGVGILKFNMQIYDRWGHLLFETNDIDSAWDGNTKGSTEPIKQDVYVWKAEVQDVFHKNHDLSGHVSLIK
jgi:gliding motility-associated-like protein